MRKSLQKRRIMVPGEKVEYFLGFLLSNGLGARFPTFLNEATGEEVR